VSIGESYRLQYLFSAMFMLGPCVCQLNGTTVVGRCHNTILYDTIAEFNVHSKAECGQLNLAHVAETKKV